LGWWGYLRSYTNSNDIYTILDLIKKEIRKNNFDNIRNSESNFLDSNTDDIDRVVSREVFRGSNGIINSIKVTYESDVTETIELFRGLTPPVSNTLPEHDYINNVMIVGARYTKTNGSEEMGTVSLDIFREGGVGRVTKISYNY
jgi:hypothetical protein